MVLVGRFLRIAGFVWLGFAEAAWAVIGSVLLIGFAAALFSPAVESEVARQAVVWEEGHGSITRVLGLLSADGQAGAFVGPLLSALLLAVDFRTARLAGAGVFVLVLTGHAWLMPQHIPGRVRVTENGGLPLVPHNRRSRALCCAYGSYLLAYNQLYLALPDEAERATCSQTPPYWLFALSPCWWCARIIMRQPTWGELGEYKPPWGACGENGHGLRNSARRTKPSSHSSGPMSKGWCGLSAN